MNITLLKMGKIHKMTLAWKYFTFFQNLLTLLKRMNVISIKQNVSNGITNNLSIQAEI